MPFCFLDYGGGTFMLFPSKKREPRKQISIEIINLFGMLDVF